MDEVETVSEKESSHAPRLLVWLRNKILAGLVVVIPLVATLLVLRFVYTAISAVFDPVVKAFVKENRASLPEVIVYNDTIPFAAFIITTVIILIFGLLVTNVFGRRLLGYFERLLLRIPFVNMIYPLAKQVVDSIKLIGANTENLNPEEARKVVYIPYPGLTGYLVAFQTGRFRNKQGVAYASVFVPTAPNPITGFVLVFKESDILESDLTMEEAWKLLVSAGFVTPLSKGNMPVPAVNKTTREEAVPEPVDTRQKE